MSGLIETRPGLTLNPAGYFYSKASVQPTFVRAFGEDTSLGQVVNNMVYGGAPASLLGTPTIGATGLTCVPNNVSGLILPIAAGQPLTIFIVASCPTFGGAAPLLGQLIGTNSVNGLQFEFHSANLFAFVGGDFIYDAYSQSYAGGAPVSPKLYMLQYNPDNGTSPDTSSVTFGDLTDGATMSSFTKPAVVTGSLGSNNLVLGSYPASTAGAFTSPTKFNFVSVTSGILSSVDITLSKQQIQKLMPVYGGVTV